MHPLIPKLMREAREKKGLKQSEVAEKMNMKGATISSWELGKSEPDIDEFVQYCGLCGASYVDILKQAYGDPTKQEETTEYSETEREIIYMFRALDGDGKRRTLRQLRGEYEDAIADFGEESRNVT